MKRMNFKEKWVVVTGASSGLGREIALYLAKVEQANIIIAARRTERLAELKKRIESETNSKVKTITIDLSKEGSGEKLFKSATKEQTVYAIINNAGLTAYEVATSANLETYNKIINLNFRNVIETSLLFLEYFKEKKDGGIMNIGSMLGLFPSPYQTVYCATKYGLGGFTLALIGENINEPVTITLYSPGGIKTEMVETSGLEDKFGKNNIFNMDAAKVAKKAVIAFKKNKAHSIPGLMNRAADIFQRILPKKALAYLSEKSYRHKDKMKK